MENAFDKLDRELQNLNSCTIKSESFNRTTLITKRTKEVVGGLLLEKALSIAPNYWQHAELNELSKVALNLGLLDVADKIIEMT